MDYWKVNWKYSTTRVRVVLFSAYWPLRVLSNGSHSYPFTKHLFLLYINTLSDHWCNRAKFGVQYTLWNANSKSQSWPVDDPIYLLCHTSLTLNVMNTFCSSQVWILHSVSVSVHDYGIFLARFLHLMWDSERVSTLSFRILLNC